RAAASVHATLDAGASHLALAGRVPLGAGALALRMQGAAELAMLDPFLESAGRSVAGHLRADLRLAGTLAAPVPSGTLALRRGSFLDYSSGIHLRAIAADLTANGRRIDIARMTAAAGSGSVALAGTVDLADPADPHLALTLRAAHASLPQTDLMSAVLGADLSLTGSPARGLDLGGTVTVTRADIRVPARLPATVATLHVIRPGQAPPPAAPSAFAGLPARIHLALTLRAPEQIYVRGRGLDAELGGMLRLSGTAAQPISAGGFSLRRGRFSMAGHTLDFTSGRIGFNGASLTDPTLHFVATSTANGVTAQLTVTGTASAPRIALSSTPSLPPDEVLSQLLFHTSTSSLGPFEIAQLAATLASLSGSAPGVAAALSDPLSGVRNALGLDQLSLGSAANGNTPQIKAGRYLGRHVYAGVRQDTGTGGTEAEMRIDLTRRLSLRATAGTLDTATATAAGQGAAPQAGTSGSVGVIYKFNY
ncbi:MAG: translocation/assembly module TamB domain-containing protein, partial [Rhodospirillales bacterium]|nr:translocation/assembly module TamB domain-containing protein [Rhodospirillales bacterium]